jgi:SAM-dependent methyltransferase
VPRHSGSFARLAQQLIVDVVAELAALLDLPEPVVEFGSLQVEPDQPNDLRPLFEGRSYIGTDVRAGPGVDRIEDLRSLSFADSEVGTALCLDTLEHCADPLTACRELHRVLRDDGVCVISSVMFFPIHGYPHDYWRFTPDGFRILLEPFEDVWVEGVGHPELPTQVIGIATKGRTLTIPSDGLRVTREAQSGWDRSEGRIAFGIVQVPLRELFGTLARQLPRAAAQRARARLSRGA